MLPHLFTNSVSRQALPGPWVETMPDICGMQLRMDWVATPGGQLHTTLVHHPTPNWLSANSVAHIHRLIEVLAPPNHQLWVGSCPWCQHAVAVWIHTLQDCASFWEVTPLEARYWLTLFKTRGVSYGLVGTLTWTLGLFELAGP